MNERIRKLAIQAAGKGYQTFGTSDFDSLEKIEKFAELIVRECADFLTDDLDYPDAALRLKQHFGVAE
jgi:hypothetical protein